MSISVIVMIALGIELGQMLLPGKFPDTTDWFLESLGGILGYVLLRIIRTRLATAPRSVSKRRQGSKRERSA